MNKTLSCIVALLLAVCMLPAAAFAAGPIDTSRDVTMSIAYDDNEKPLVGAQFSIYQVATVDEAGKLSVTEAFGQFPVDIKGRDDDAWKALASTLEGYVLRDGVTPTDSSTTDEEGDLTFPTSGKHLEQGLYLVLGQRLTQDGCYYDASPFMVMLPAQDAENNDWLYEVAVSPKFDRTEVPDEPTTITRKVLKVWDDKGGEYVRPTEVTVQLLQDGKVYDTVTLNADNDWRHTWTELDDSHTWTIAEESLEGYIATVTREGTTFVLTNTYTPVDSNGSVERTVCKVWDDKGYESKRPTSVQVTLLQNGAAYDMQVLSNDNGWRYTWSGLPKYDAAGNEIAWSLSEAYVPGYTSTVTANGQVFTLTNTFNAQNLPQTGALWWPVPLFVCAGLAFVVAGVAMGKAKRGHDEAK